MLKHCSRCDELIPIFSHFTSRRKVRKVWKRHISNTVSERKNRNIHVMLEQFILGHFILGHFILGHFILGRFILGHLIRYFSSLGISSDISYPWAFHPWVFYPWAFHLIHFILGHFIRYFSSLGILWKTFHPWATLFHTGVGAAIPSNFIIFSAGWAGNNWWTCMEWPLGHFIRDISSLSIVSEILQHSDKLMSEMSSHFLLSQTVYY